MKVKTNFDLNYFIEIVPALIKYINITLSLSVISMFLGLGLALMLQVIRMYKIKGLNSLAKIYISFFRGTPLLVQLFLLYYGLPQVIPTFKTMDAYSAAILGLSLNSSAYMAEVFRAAVSSIDKGQMEAALSVGMTHWQGMKRIVMPQALRVAVPSLGNVFIDLIKGSSLAFTLGLVEILAQAKISAAASYKFFESYLAVAVIYWIIIVVFNYLQSILENKMNTVY